MDTQKNGYLPIPNLLFDILRNNQNLTVGEIKKCFGGKYNLGIDSYFSYLINEEYGFFTDEPNCFPEIDTAYLSPYGILTSVIIINHESNFKLVDVLLQLIELGCQHIQIRIFRSFSIKDLNTELECLRGTRVKLVEIFIPDNNSDIDALKAISNLNLRLKFVIYSNQRKLVNCIDRNIFVTKKRLILNQEEIISQEFFISNLQFYIESKNRNVGLNQKVSINFDGSIKNYPSHSTSFGNIRDIEIKDIINKAEFQQKWFIKNEDIEKCMDCEYRYMCLSNSDIYVIEGKYYKVNKCQFDPYTGQWGEIKKK